MGALSLPEAVTQDQLLMRRRRLEAALGASPPHGTELRDLLHQVDRALASVEAGTFGLCQACHEPVEEERLFADPLVCYCLDCLTETQRRALEADLVRAAHIQTALLPPSALATPGWDIHYLYQPLGPVSGDYCDLLPPEAPGGGLHFVVGDVSGKGVSAAILMSYLQAIFRGLARDRCPLSDVVAAANRMMDEGTLPNHYATVVCGRAGEDGQVEMVNAGHCPPLLLSRGQVRELSVDGLPVGLFHEGVYGEQRVALDPGDALLLFSDGLSEARNAAGEEYGAARIIEDLGRSLDAGAEELVRTCVTGLERFRGGRGASDDLTVMVVQRTG
jgi:sigma-B regulation protein RsbU (phosphoserine phosphatase)